ncbi:MAG: BamA/TamA family outer membrane protein [Ignavibacterium sp.]|nr:MAG: BamA/TamA family outer membrane protein [Ignavibacterium sp.]
MLIIVIIPTPAQEKKTISLELRKKNLPFGLTEYVPSIEPVIGLALSGGGARAISQIGALRAFEEAGIEIDVIVGTSMGSILGGLYASGYTVDEMDSIVVNTNWDELLYINGEASRRELFVDQKITEDRALFALRLDGLKLILPTSFNDGQKLSNYLYLLTNNAPVHPKNSFDDLWYKYRAVCTDLISGERIVLNSGDLSRAMRASSSISFLLEPVKWEDWLLVDGGLLSNIPVDVTRTNSTDLVIAVNNTSPLRPEGEIDVLWNIADQVVSIPMKKLNEQQLSNADFVIEPNVKTTTTEFINLDSVIISGYNAALSFINTIKSSIDSVKELKAKENNFFIENIEIVSSDITELNSLLLDYKNQDSVSSSQIKIDLASLYKTGKYKSIEIELTRLQNLTQLEFNYELNPIIKTIKTIGITQLDSTEVDLQLSPIKNISYSNRLVAKSASQILKLYRQKGYLLANLNKLDFDGQTGQLLLYFDEGIISSIRVEGNYTRETLITREIPIKEGDYFEYNKVKTGLDNLRSTRYFKDIALYVTEKNGENNLIIYVDERLSGILRFSFLVNEVYNAQISFDIRDENLLGTGTELGLFLFGGASNRAYILELKNQRILETYFTYNLSAYYKFSDINVYQDVTPSANKTFSREKVGEYRQIFYGASLSLGRQIEKFGNLIFKGTYQFDEVKNKEGDATQPYKTKIVILGVNTTVDNLDRIPYPLKGLSLYGFYETAQTFLGGDQSYISLGFDAKYFFQLGKRSTVVPRLKIGFGDETMPLSEQFLLGGMDTFFGMRENEFRGRQIFLASLMYRIKLPFKIFFNTYVKLRYDLGSTWEVRSQIRWRDMRHGIGGVLSFDTPIGPADFAIGRSFLLRKDLPENPIVWGDLLFYFSIGYRVNISPASF